MDRGIDAEQASSGGPQGFYQALHRAFDEVLAEHSGRPSLVDAVLGLAFDSFDGNVAIQCEDELPLACKRGCATCCTLRVGATIAEVLMVARFLRAVSPTLQSRGIDLMARIRDANQHTLGLGEAERVKLRQPCPFIARGVCIIYMVRPLACRGHASHDVKACIAAARGEVMEVPYSHGHFMVRALVQNAMQSSLRAAGLGWGQVELNHAVLLALAQPELESRWLNGEVVLQEAALHDLPVEEMESVFDRLRPH